MCRIVGTIVIKTRVRKPGATRQSSVPALLRSINALAFNFHLLWETANEIHIKMRTFVSLLLTACLLLDAVDRNGQKAIRTSKKGLKYETAQQWEKAAQEFTLAVAADPANTEYQTAFSPREFQCFAGLHAAGTGPAEQRTMSAHTTLFARHTGMIWVNTLAVSEMERMPAPAGHQKMALYRHSRRKVRKRWAPRRRAARQPRNLLRRRHNTEQLRLISYSGDLKTFIATC